MIGKCLGLAGLALCLPALPAKAADDDLLSLSAGWFDVFLNDDDALALTAEYRWAREFWIFQPFVGGTATSDLGGHVFAGVLVEAKLTERIYLTPSLAPGLYFKGNGKDLGSVIQFRSQIELAYRFDDMSRLAIGLAHISNAGIEDKNPGAEIAFISYQMPLSRLGRLF